MAIPTPHHAHALARSVWMIAPDRSNSFTFSRACATKEVIGYAPLTPSRDSKSSITIVNSKPSVCNRVFSIFISQSFSIPFLKPDNSELAELFKRPRPFAALDQIA
jgi:hypothetical protein